MLNQLRIISNNLKPRIGSNFLNCLNSRMASNEPKITVTNDGMTIVCWHSEEAFPYEHSRPIPQQNDILKEDESVLKIQHRIDGQNMFSGDGPNVEELQIMTFTPKTNWTRKKLKRVIPQPTHPRKGV